MAEDYAAFLTAKSSTARQTGSSPAWLPDFLFRFQQHLTGWAIRRAAPRCSRTAASARPRMQLAWAQNVHQHTGSRC